jgi:hypothetical protein
MSYVVTYTSQGARYEILVSGREAVNKRQQDNNKSCNKLHVGSWLLVVLVANKSLFQISCIGHKQSHGQVSLTDHQC